MVLSFQLGFVFYDRADKLAEAWDYLWERGLGKYGGRLTLGGANATPAGVLFTGKSRLLFCVFFFCVAQATNSRFVSFA